jgi:hypothetical protein
VASEDSTQKMTDFEDAVIGVSVMVVQESTRSDSDSLDADHWIIARSIRITFGERIAQRPQLSWQGLTSTNLEREKQSGISVDTSHRIP